MTIAVLALQGAFLEHEQMLERLEVDYFEIRKKSDLKRSFDGLILPGGESTAMGKLLQELKMMDDLKEQIEQDMPVLGTCAGMILLAKEFSNDANTYFATMPICVRRNAYGRQLGSFETRGTFADSTDIPMIFIRAPYMEAVYEGTRALSVVNEKIVAAQYKNQVVTSFHPELTGDITVHQHFLNLI
ncbi:pyridoxal 5'-phosphate synthase glutaminase subunit PdxT [Anaeromicropila populeti]|uniref:Pyridoxal phosphate synthase yaaE subunit n=1 Tax=Anaeromicropila populeti TaxID=37658 RepID=A0A1I6JN11_9FIRM|nr:pyridoxal 5'-phosphate synthase glutaminase subunit PdxT [Anaeromicropila populeti]SFR80372.1 pyridoxal phosphate synthase yaaE subunit [Anaeromicropila populeti]